MAEGTDQMTEVRDLEEVRGQRVRVTLENGTCYTLLKSMVRERSLAVGTRLDPEEFANWVLLRQYRSALDQAVSLLAVRACSRGEIQQKLRRTGYSEETVEMVIAKLEQNNLLNDPEFADQWTRYRAQKYGPRRIAQELRMKGVSAEDIENAVAEIPEEEQLEQAVRLAEKSLRSAKAGEDPRKTRQRILSALVRRGYDWDLARQAVEQILAEED